MGGFKTKNENIKGHSHNVPYLLATVFGDPHFYTFDGKEYTFNGKGEFVLVRADSPRVKLDVQGRFEQVISIKFDHTKFSQIFHILSIEIQLKIY